MAVSGSQHLAHQLYMYSVQPQDPCAHTACKQLRCSAYAQCRNCLLRCAALRCAVPCRWVFLGEGLPSITFALMLPCLLPGGPGKMRSSRWLSHAELQLLRADVSLTGWRQQLLQLLGCRFLVCVCLIHSAQPPVAVFHQHAALCTVSHAVGGQGLLGRVTCRGPVIPAFPRLLQRELPDKKHLSNEASANSSSDTAALPGHVTGVPDSALGDTPTSIPLRPSDSSSAAARADLPTIFQPQPAADTLVLDTQERPAILDWQLLLCVVRTGQIWVLACSEAVKSEQWK